MSNRFNPTANDFRRYLGAIDQRLAVTALELITTTGASATVAETERYSIQTVRWPVFEGVFFGEGLLLQPKSGGAVALVAVPDADQTPEMLVGLAPGCRRTQFARRLAEGLPGACSGADRSAGRLVGQRGLDGLPISRIASGFIGRLSYGPACDRLRSPKSVGRRGLAYCRSIQFTQRDTPQSDDGVVGFGEGGLIAFYSAALDARIAPRWSAVISAATCLGGTDLSQRLGLLHEFGDAEMAG